MNDGTKPGVLLVVNGTEAIKNVTLPKPAGAGGFELLWDSAIELPPEQQLVLTPGAKVRLVETSIQLFRVL